MTKLFKLAKKISKVLLLPWKYKKTLRFLLWRGGGIRNVLNFLFVKYFVADEGGEISILNPLITKFPRLAGYPYKIEVEITNKCNKHCIFCEHTYWQEPPRDISFEDFKKIISQFPGLRWINMTGEGSGFLNKDFMAMIELARSRNISVNFVDEFEFMNRERAQKIIALGVNCIWVSMDGATKETYEKIKVGCHFDLALENIRNFLRLRKELSSPLPTICFRFIVTTLNFTEMSKMVELVHSFGDLGEGSRLEFVGLLTFPGIERYYLSEIPKEILETTKIRAKELGIMVSFTHAEKNTLRDVSQCVAWHEPYIMMGGYILPCCAILMSNRRDFLRQHSLGNIFNQPFKNIWYSKRYRQFRRMVPRKTGAVPLLCVGCRGFDASKREKKYGICKEG